mgnify:CR=1 FL=1
MGKLEQEVKVQIRRTKINSAIIATIATAGVITVAMIAPNVLGAISKTKYFRQRKYQLKSSIARLISAGYLVTISENGKKYLQLTKKGERHAALIGEGALVPKKPKRWDGKWRILIFDIPEQRKYIREKIRTTLAFLGFVRLQDSVWVYPYDCEDIIIILKTDLRIGRDMLYIIADKIEYDMQLRKQFFLPASR